MADNEANLASEEMKEKVLTLLPQQKPFRFVDRIVELSDSHIIGEYRYREDEYFYKGHFPQKPVTPGVILIETMAQFGIVAQGIYILLAQGEEMVYTTLFTEAEIEFSAMVPPNSLVRVYGEKIFLRRKKLKANVRMELEDGTLAASGTLAGMGVEI